MRVFDSTGEEPISGAEIRIEAGEDVRVARTDAGGTALLRGLPPGRGTLSVQALGFLPWEGEIELRNGFVERRAIALEPDPVGIAELRAVATREGGGEGALRLDRTEVERSGAATVAEAIEALPGVVLRREGAGGPARISLRGGGAGSVLVLVDGVVLNDPVTGEADLSTLSAHLIESVTVLPGARSARWGPGAESGVVLVETRRSRESLEVAARAGSLGEYGGSLAIGGKMSGLHLSLALDGTRLDGGFPFTLPPSVGGGERNRENADLSRHGGAGALTAPLLGGELTLRASGEEVERGIPGVGYAPARHARQEVRRGRVVLGWRRDDGARRTRLVARLDRDRLDVRDPTPPAGPPYEDRTRLSGWEVEGELVGALERGGGSAGEWGAGLRIRSQTIGASSLGTGTPPSLTDVGAHLRGGWEHRPHLPRLSAALRLDHRAGDAVLSHEVAVTQRVGAFRLRLAHRSAFTPPSLSDQYVRAGFGVAPNPDLEAQRIPSEWEGAVEWLGSSADGRWEWRGEGTAYSGAVRGMILWLPDFRFIWSPRNADALREGGTVSFGIEERALGVRVRGWYSLARIRWDRERSDERIQLPYRPEHSGRLQLSLTRGRWSGDLVGDFVGTRHSVPSRLNALDPFTTWSAGGGVRIAPGGHPLVLSLRIDRIFDEKDALIFGFPESGRSFRLEVRSWLPGKTGDS